LLYKLYEEIVTHSISYGIGAASVEEIDSMNILQATLLAMKRAVDNLTRVPSEVWIDGNCAPKLIYPTKTIVGGDLLEPCISAASIMAKVTRDRIMLDYDQKYPQYGFAAHKGYGTALHQAALEKCGASPIHRRSFAPVKKVLLMSEIK
jgi:ribonuclease HII